ncbi:MAG: hypothetical protein RLZZ127_1757 [Planctomycetota bacterium]|jgi:mannitol-1-phosphate 5-dehydrogenase
MPTLVQVGAGNIGRGFIAPTFAAAGWRVVFIDVAPAVLAALAERGGYRVLLVDGEQETVQTVTGVSGVNGRDLEAAATAIAGADLVATSVGLGALPHAAPALAEGLRRRPVDRPLDILVCENGAQAHTVLRDLILARLPESERAAADRRLGCVRTSIGRMIPPERSGDPLDIRVEPYAKLPVERAAFRGPVPVVPNLYAKDDFDRVLAEKLYLHNLTHACLAYAGHLRGCATIPDCMQHADLVAEVDQVAQEVALAFSRKWGEDAGAEARMIAADLFHRYRNRALSDPVARVARDPWRKLAADDRLVGAARLCLDQGIRPRAICRAIGLALLYTPASDEPRAAEWLALSPSARLSAAAGLTPEDPIMAASTYHAQLASRRAAAAQAMRAAGLVLRDDEAAAIEIADFGLDRYAEYGLAIHVYVNTDRCCAKELVMTPGQICPEHRHPPVDGDPGKEETFRVRQGEVFLYLPGHKQDGAEKAAALARVPADKHAAHTMYKCVHLKPGEQYTLKPNTPHWFVAGPQGAIVSEFSTKSRDEVDVFTDTAIVRVPPAA